jgi:hypothetical protein
MDNDPLEIIETWKKYAADLLHAVEQRRYKSFRISMVRGEKYFRKIRKMLQGEDSEKIKKYSGELKDAIALWDQSTEGLRTWMAETKAQIESGRKKRINDKKINSAYSFIKKSGNRLKVKVK